VSTGLPRDLASNPRLSRWISVAPDGLVSLRVGKVELGQGILTALTQIAADELGIDPAQLRMLPASTAEGPDEGHTAGSMSVQDCGSAVRQVCAQVRQLFLTEAAAVLGADVATLDVRGGVLSSAGLTTSTTYGDLAARVDLDRDAGATAVTTTSLGRLRLTGVDLPRLDLPDKVTGRRRFIQDLVLPDMVWGRVVRPPSPAAVLLNADLEGAKQRPGVVDAVRDGSFLGVVVSDERDADLAAEWISRHSSWSETAGLPDEDDVSSYLRSGPSTADVVDAQDPGRVGKGVVRRAGATYTRPFLAHASMSPSCGVARWTGDDVHVWSHSQGIFALRRAIAAALGIGADRVSVEHAEGAGAYGHNAADDAAFDAVLLARTVPGRPVQVRWSRRDELTWSPFGSAMAVDLSAGLGSDGRVLSWDCDVWSQGHTARPGYAGSPGLLAAAHLSQPHALPAPVDPPPDRGGGSGRNASPGYAFPARRITTHVLQSVALRTSSMRSLGAFMNVFAIESFMDELAMSAGSDPLDYRLEHLDDERARAVVLAAADRAGWRSRDGADDVGHGIALARYKGKGAYCAVVAEVEAVSEIRLRRLIVAVDVGQVINPDGVRNQLEGGAVQAASWTLKERVRFDRCRVTSGDWETYPILRFSEVPAVEVVVLDRPDQPSVGAGEAAQGPTAAAIGNAVADAVGVRVRDLPLTTERVLAALDA
jgi:nicotinate dehydrogenase subunit B